MRDLELELDEEKRRHAETIKILRKKERHVKEVLIQNEEDQKNISLLQEMLDKTTQKVNIYKRQLTEQVSNAIIGFVGVSGKRYLTVPTKKKKDSVRKSEKNQEQFSKNRFKIKKTN